VLDDTRLHFSFKKGRKQIQESHSLSDLSSTLGYWKGYPQSTKRNFAMTATLLVVAFCFLYFASALWMLICSIIMFYIALEVIYGEIGFFLPNEYTVISFRDGSDCLYLQRTPATDIERAAFEMALRDAIVMEVGQEKHNPSFNSDWHDKAVPAG
jgi:hypothetical protein